VILLVALVVNVYALRARGAARTRA
jgi:hypothetical protein